MNTPESRMNESARDLAPTGKRRTIARSAVAILATAIAGTTLVLAQEKVWHHGPGWHGEDMAQHLQHHVTHVLSNINVTDQQRAQIDSIVLANARDMQAAHEQHSGVHKQLHEILSAPAIDRARLEALRADHLRLVDEHSGRALNSLADIAAVLTPEQRSTLAAKMQERHR